MLEGLLQQGNLRYLDYEKVKKSWVYLL
jgi:hypothetical protein